MLGTETTVDERLEWIDTAGAKVVILQADVLGTGAEVLTTEEVVLGTRTDVSTDGGKDIEVCSIWTEGSGIDTEDKALETQV